MNQFRTVTLAALLACSAAVAEFSRGNWRRYVRSKGPRAAAVGRRAFHRDAAAVEFILDYNDADTKTRATEAPFQDPRLPSEGGTGVFAWAYVGGLLAANWLASNVMRIFVDGAILIEEARTNKMPESDLDTWTLIGSATVSTDDATAPDLDTNADTITFTALATDAITHETTIAAGAGSDNDSAFVTCWLRCTSGTEEARIGLMDKDTVTRLLSADLTVTTTWTRFSFEVTDIGAGVVAPDGLIQNSSDAAARSIEAWGFQVEHLETIVSSDTRTAGAAGTQNADDAEFSALTAAQAAAFAASWTLDFWPNWSSTVTRTTNARVLHIGTASDRLDMFFPGTSGGQLTISVGGVPISTGVLAFAVGDRLRVHATAEPSGPVSIRLENVTQSTTSTTGSGTGGAAVYEGQALQVGAYWAGALWQADAVIGQPVVA